MMRQKLHLLFKAAWQLKLLWNGLMRRQLTGAQVMVWYGDSLLLITNSYRRGFNLPGGSIGRSEPPASAAVRELGEETGIDVVEQDLNELGIVNYDIQGVDVRDYLFAVRLSRFQRPIVDGVEVVEVAFFPVNHARNIEQLSHLHHHMQPETLS